MLTLMPLSGIQSVLRRKNSKDYDFSRRGSLSVYSTYSLPTSKSSMRRFSSYEELAPIFQQFLAQQSGLVENTSPNVTPTPSPPPPPPPEKRRRRSSLSLGKRWRKLSGVSITSESSVEDGSNGSSRKCSIDDLDNLFTKIREQLAQLKNEDIDMCQRVDNLQSSVGGLYRECSVDHNQQLTMSCESPLATSPLESVGHRRQSTTMPSNLSSNSLTVIRESSFELLDDECDEQGGGSSDDDEQSFEEYCRTHIPKLGASHPTRQPISFPALDDVDLPAQHIDPKQYCLPNNLELRPKSQSAPQLQLIKNDLSDSAGSDGCGSHQRWSVISVKSDSILITSKGSSYHSDRPFDL